MGTRKEVREALKKRKEYEENYMQRLRLLFHNSIVVENVEEKDLPKRYLFHVLLEKGGIAYDKLTGLYLPFVKQGVDVYGLPQKYTLIGYNGYVVTRNPDEVVILRANDICEPLELYFLQQTKKLVDIDLAIEQNLDAIKTTTIAEVVDESALLSLENEYKAKRIGATVIFKNAQARANGELKVSQTGAQYLVDKLLEARKEILNETLSTIGIAVANTDKRERVQGLEVLASEGYAVDCINTLIDTFNHDAKSGDLPIRLKGNTSLLEQFNAELNEKQNEKGEKENETNGKEPHNS